MIVHEPNRLPSSDTEQPESEAHRIPRLSLRQFTAEAGRAIRAGLPEEAWVEAVILAVSRSGSGYNIDLIERDEDHRVRYHYTLIDFVAEAASPALRAGSDAAEARWFEIAELETLGLWSETVRVIKLAGERRPCR